MKYDEILRRRTAMAGIERLTITLSSDMAAVVKGAAADADSASSSEVVREAGNGRFTA